MKLVWYVWLKELKLPKFRFQTLVAVMFISVEIFFLRAFMTFVETRQGILLNDIILSHLPAVDLSVPIFVLIYGVCIFTFLQLIKTPDNLIKAYLAYGVLILFRSISLYFVALEAPINIIPLKDPLLEFAIYNNYTLMKDLFFSGHTATLVLCVLLVKAPVKKWIILITILVAVMLLIQHAHYTIDVLAAPFFAWQSYVLVFKHKKVSKLLKPILTKPKPRES